jgi:hypothetical protein
MLQVYRLVRCAQDDICPSVWTYRRRSYRADRPVVGRLDVDRLVSGLHLSLSVAVRQRATKLSLQNTTPVASAALKNQDHHKRQTHL